MHIRQSFQKHQLIWPIVGVLGLALILGLAYNNVSPLGVRWKTSTSLVENNRKAAGPQSIYENETVSMALERKNEAIGYENESLALSIVPRLRPMPGPQTSQTGGAPAPRRIPQVTWSEVRPLVLAGKIVLVDVREHSYYEAEHIPGAISLPSDASSAQVAAFAAKYSRTTPIVVYCGSEECSLAQRMAQNLMSQGGYASVAVLAGGYTAWRLAQEQNPPLK